MNERARNVIVGITGVLGLVGLAVIMTLFGYVPHWLEPGYTLQVELDQAGGVTEGSQVKLSGINIGRVEAVFIKEERPYGVVAVAFIQQGVRIPKAIKVGVQSPLIGGSPSNLTFYFDPETVDFQDIWPVDGSAVIRGVRAPSFASEVAQELRAVLDEPFQNFQRLSHSWTEVAVDFRELIRPRTLQEVDQGRAQGNLATVLARADQRLKELQASLTGINELLNDPQIRENIRQAAANAVDVTKRIGAGADRLQQLAQDAGQHLDELRKRYVQVADDLSRAINSAQRAIDDLRTGGGTTDKLLHDPSVYNNLNDAIERIGKAAIEFRLLIEKWKKEGLPIQY